MKINNCRSCQSKELISCLNLGSQFLTGIFPKNRNQQVSRGNLALKFCKKCSLLQLDQNFNRNEMYGSNYGYTSYKHQDKRITHKSSCSDWDNYL